MKNSKAFLDDMLEYEFNMVAQSRAAFERAKASEDWLVPEVFGELLALGMRHADVTAADLAKAEGVSRSAISKWVNLEATPPRATRKTVLLWLEEKFERRAEELQLALAEHDEIEDRTELAL